MRAARRSAAALSFFESMATIGLLCLAASSAAVAHSASDAYLTLTAEKSSAAGSTKIHGQWDIALRDLDFALKLDENGDGRLTWGEVRHRQSAIDQYAYRYLKIDAGEHNACSITPGRQMIDEHADGAYAALFFEAVCAHAPRKITLHYTLFFAIDPSHRGIFVMKSESNIATALLSPENADINVGL
jgi:hypothetical protein